MYIVHFLVRLMIFQWDVLFSDSLPVIHRSLAGRVSCCTEFARISLISPPHPKWMCNRWSSARCLLPVVFLWLLSSLMCILFRGDFMSAYNCWPPYFTAWLNVMVIYLVLEALIAFEIMHQCMIAVKMTRLLVLVCCLNGSCWGLDVR